MYAGYPTAISLSREKHCRVFAVGTLHLGYSAPTEFNKLLNLSKDITTVEHFFHDSQLIFFGLIVIPHTSAISDQIRPAVELQQVDSMSAFRIITVGIGLRSRDMLVKFDVARGILKRGIYEERLFVCDFLLIYMPSALVGEKKMIFLV